MKALGIDRLRDDCTWLGLSGLTAQLRHLATGSIPSLRLSRVADDGWAKTTVNTVIFRRHPVLSQAGRQFTAFYDGQRRVVIARRRLGTEVWEKTVTEHSGRPEDAHNSISLGLDGAGFLHVSWGQHGSPLLYARSVEPNSMQLGPVRTMVGRGEGRVTYPEFHQLPGGDLLFLYRDGKSGRGNLVINRMAVASGSWRRVQDNLLDGEAARNAYWQTALGRDGVLHLSWVWRESRLVETNHDIGYARSADGGASWTTVGGRTSAVPITLGGTDFALRVPQDRELINQTSMAVDDQGRPYIATYFRQQGQDVPQLQLILHDGLRWRCHQVSARVTPFRLAGGGTKRIPLSRPLVIVGRGAVPAIRVIFRDAERGNRVSVVTSTDAGRTDWRVADLTRKGVGQWEPGFDPAMWTAEGKVHLFLQETEQVDGEGSDEARKPTAIHVLEWSPLT